MMRPPPLTAVSIFPDPLQWAISEDRPVYHAFAVTIAYCGCGCGGSKVVRYFGSEIGEDSMRPGDMYPLHADMAEFVPKELFVVARRETIAYGYAGTQPKSPAPQD